MAVGNFQLVAGNLALDFTNTLDYRFDRSRIVELLPTYERFLEFAKQAGVISGQQVTKLIRRTSKDEAILTLQRMIELREALDSLFRAVATGKPISQSSLRALNRFLAAPRGPESLIQRRSEFVRCGADLAEKPDGPLWPIIDAAVNLLTSPDRAHVRECGEPSCRWLFLDRSKNQSRRWCDMDVCGNRAKVRRFRARKRRPHGVA